MEDTFVKPTYQRGKDPARIAKGRDSKGEGMLATSILTHNSMVKGMSPDSVVVSIVPKHGKLKSIAHPSSVPYPADVNESRAGNATGLPDEQSNTVLLHDGTYCPMSALTQL